MKKCLLLVVLLLFYSTGFSQDACSKAYSEALQSFGKGNYEDAQRKFLAVAQTCTNYTDVWKYLSECNKKIADKQKKQALQMDALKNEYQQLEAEKKKADTECNNNLANAAVQVRRAENIVKLKSDTIQMQRKWNLVWRDSVMKVNRRLDSISLLLDTANLKIDSLKTILILSEKPTKKKDKKHAEKQDPIIPPVLDTLAVDAHANDPIVINNKE